MRKVIVLLVFIFLLSKSYSQTILMEEDVNTDSIQSMWGKNLTHYGHFYMSCGFVSSLSDEGASIIYGASGTYAVGYRYKLKASNYYAIGVDVNISSLNYRLKQEDDKILPNDIEHDKENIQFSRLKTEIYQRISFDRRGNHIGKYMDIGVFGSYIFSTKHFYKDEVENENFSTREVTEKGLEYFENISYGITTRFGIDKWVIFADYRLSNLFKQIEGQSTPYPELPRLMVGVELSIF